MGGSLGVVRGMLARAVSAPVRNTACAVLAILSAGGGAAMEQLVSQAAKHRYMSGGQVKVPLTVRTQGGAGWSPGAQHAQQLESWFVHVPGLKVVFPST